MKEFPQIEITIDDCSIRGFGLAAHPTLNAKIEVAHAIPGDRVRVELMRRRHKIQKGRLIELLSRSKDRVEPRCEHAFLCGGCTWQTMDYSAQIQRKTKNLQKIFRGLFDRPISILPCKEPWHYRNKMEFTFSENRAGSRFLGLMIAHAEPYVFDLQRCQIAPQWMSECLARVRIWWEQSGLKAYHPSQNSGILRYLTLRSTNRSEQKMAILNVAYWEPEQESSLLQAIGEEISVVIRIHQTRKGTPTAFTEHLLRGPEYLIEELHLAHEVLRFKVSPSSFFQPNPRQAEHLYNLVIQNLGISDLVYDLYCGAGTLSLAASSCTKEVIGIELNPQAVLDAQENAILNEKSNVRFLQGDVGSVLSRLSQKPDAVLVDPPRAGLDESALVCLKKLSPKKIIYVSCNPLTQAENIRELSQAGYALDSLQGVDQFPHTPHIETVALLSLKKTRV